LLREAVPKVDINSIEIHNALYALSERGVGIWSNRFGEPFPLDFSVLDMSKSEILHPDVVGQRLPKYESLRKLLTGRRDGIDRLYMLEF
jgi:hypothetical protein